MRKYVLILMMGCLSMAGIAWAAGEPGAAAVPAGGQDAWTTGGTWPTVRMDIKTSVKAGTFGVLDWGKGWEIEYGNKVEHCALKPEELAAKFGKIVEGHPRMLIRAKPWKGGLSVEQFRERAKQDPWAKQFKTAPPMKKGREMDVALYYLATGDESVIPGLVDYVMSAKDAFNCGGGMIGPCQAYDWIANSPTLTDEQKKKMEEIVNQKISEQLPVIRSELDLAEAEKLNAEHEFGQKYPECVSVYSVGPTTATPTDPQFARAFSIEFCGGPHVANTGDLAGPSGNLVFKILKEEAVAAGIRRIKAVLTE